jgi:hypothetical protein
VREEKHDKLYLWTFRSQISQSTPLHWRLIPPKKRLIEHLSEAKANPNYPYKNIWINQLLKKGRKPKVRILCESCNACSEEEQINLCKAKGMILLNLTHNGKKLGQDGGHLVSSQEIEKMRESLGLGFTRALF